MRKESMKCREWMSSGSDEDEKEWITCKERKWMEFEKQTAELCREVNQNPKWRGLNGWCFRFKNGYVKEGPDQKKRLWKLTMVEMHTVRKTELD